MTYSEKLKDPRWQRKRLEVMQRDSFTCLGCGTSDKTLNVHHADYLPGRNPWDYEDAVYATYCEDCHKQAHVNRMFLAQMFTHFSMPLQVDFITALVNRLKDAGDNPHLFMCCLTYILGHRESWQAALKAGFPVAKALDTEQV